METKLLEYGILGIVVIGLGAAVIALWNRYNAVQDARIEDNRVIIDTTKDSIRSVEKLTDTMEALSDRVERLGDR